MSRCVPLLLMAACCALPLSAQAQMPRPFPATALRGQIVVVQPPEILLNGQAARLAPGSRIRAENNLTQLSGGLIGLRLTVNYTVDPAGQLLDVWVLTPEERARQPWPTTPAQAAAWTFNPSSQTWSN